LIHEAIFQRRVPTLRVNPEDLLPRLDIREREIELSIETTGTTKSGIDGVWSIRCPDDDDLTSTIHSIH
jgi:hypothetical protein